jgi:outer membrane protein TolC
LYKSARVPYLDVIVAQQNALQSNLELINIAKREKITAMNVFKSIGGGWE